MKFRGVTIYLRRKIVEWNICMIFINVRNLKITITHFNFSIAFVYENKFLSTLIFFLYRKRTIKCKLL